MSTKVNNSPATDMPVFSRKALADSVERASNSIDQFQERLNNASDDIKALENWLRTKNVCIQFSYDIDDEAGGMIHWVHYGSKEWRLCLMTYDIDIMSGRQVVGDNRPLIEMPIEERLRAYKHLPDFVLALRNHLDSTDALFVDLEFRRKLLEEDEAPF